MKTKYYIKEITKYFLVGCFAYLLSSLIGWDLNIFNWNKEMIAIFIESIALSYLMYFLLKDKL